MKMTKTLHTCSCPSTQDDEVWLDVELRHPYCLSVGDANPTSMRFLTFLGDSCAGFLLPIVNDGLFAKPKKRRKRNRFSRSHQEWRGKGGEED